MPQFFFDTSDGDKSYKDVVGMDLPGANEARAAGMAALPGMADDRLPDGDRRDFTMDVRDAKHRLIYTATLSLVGRWIDGTTMTDAAARP